MLHLINGLVLLGLFQLLEPPMAEHAGMQEILVDRGQLVLQHEIQMLQNLWIALHDRRSRELSARDLGGGASGAQWKLGQSSSAGRSAAGQKQESEMGGRFRGPVRGPGARSRGV